MRSASRDTHEQMMLVGRLVERSCSLPAVPAGDWCQRAAAALLPLAGSGAVAVALVRSGPADDGAEALADAGAASGRERSSVALRSLLEADAGWERFSDGVGEGERSIRSLDAGELDGVAREKWSVFGAGVLLAASQWLDGAEGAGWRLTVVASYTEEEAEERSGMASVASAAVGALGRRAALAFGSGPEAGSRLTAREMEVLERLMLGLSIRQIAEGMGRSPHTVHDHVKSLHLKLGAKSRGALVSRALGHLGSEGKPAEGSASESDRLTPVVKPVSLAGLKV